MLQALIVNDDFFQKSILVQMFKQAGFVTESAENGLEAYEAVQERLRDKKQMFDVVLTDLNMPIMNGLEASSKINELFAGNHLLRAREHEDQVCPLIFMITANSLTDDLRQQAAAHGIYEVLQTPMTTPTISGKIMPLLIQRQF